MTEKFTLEKFGEFEFRTKITFLDSEQIENIVAKNFGGRVELTTVKMKLDELRSKLDKVTLDNLIDLGEYNDHKARLNRHYKHATLKVILTKTPSGFNLNYLDLEELDLLYSAYEVALKPFRG